MLFRSFTRTRGAAFLHDASIRIGGGENTSPFKRCLRPRPGASFNNLRKSSSWPGRRMGRPESASRPCGTSLHAPAAGDGRAPRPRCLDGMRRAVTWRGFWFWLETPGWKTRTCGRSFDGDGHDKGARTGLGGGEVHGFDGLVRLGVGPCEAKQLRARQGRAGRGGPRDARTR